MNNFTFKKSERLLKHSEFTRLKQSGKRFYDKYFIVEYTAGKSNRTRLGITVTRKTGPAAERNRLKRIIRESFRHNRQYIPAILDINIIVKKEAAYLSFSDACSAMQKMFKSLELSFDN